MGKGLKPYLYIAPAGVTILLVFLYPLIRIVQYCFQKGIGTDQVSFVGLRNFRYLFTDPVFFQAVRNNATLLLAVPVLVVVALLLAVLLFERVKGWKLFRTALFMPYVLSLVVVGTVFSYIYPLHGVLNELLEGMGLGFLAHNWLGSKALVVPSIMSVIVWRELGFGTVLFLARLMSVNETLFEAAMLDGANWWQRVRHVAVPQLRGVIEFFTVIEVITMLSWVFDYVYVITRGGPGTASVVAEYYIYSMGFRFREQGVAAAMALVLLAASAVLMYIRLTVSKRMGTYE